MDDIVERLGRTKFMQHADIEILCDEAAAEIKRLRASLLIAAGKLSTLPPFTDWHPETIYKALMEDGAEEARRG